MKHQTQREWIEQKLRENGEVTRNECLRVFNTRLAARINDLEGDGWIFEPEHRGKDYVYKLVYEPQLTLGL